MKLEIPTISEIISCNRDFSKVKINWEKFVLLENLVKEKNIDKKLKANRYLGYCILYLINNNFLEQLNNESYIIMEKNNPLPKTDQILNPKRRDIIYGFSRKEDAYQYSDISYHSINDNLIIDTYENIFEENFKFQGQFKPPVKDEWNSLV